MSFALGSYAIVSGLSLAVIGAGYKLEEVFVMGVLIVGVGAYIVQ